VFTRITVNDSRGAAIVDHIAHEALSTTQIRGALWEGAGSDRLTRGGSPAHPYVNFENSGSVRRSDGRIEWIVAPIRENQFTLNEAQVSNMLPPAGPAEGVMEFLRRRYFEPVNPPFIIQGPTLRWFENRDDLGNWGMYLEFSSTSDVTIARYDFAGRWPESEMETLPARSVHLFTIAIPNPEATAGRIFLGFGLREGTAVAFPRGAGATTEVIVRGEIILYEIWAHAT